jgi:hypothetical protein
MYHKLKSVHTFSSSDWSSEKFITTKTSSVKLRSPERLDEVRVFTRLFGAENVRIPIEILAIPLWLCVERV